MPNWCDNKLCVTGNEDQIKAFLDFDDSFLRAHFPCPEELANQISPVHVCDTEDDVLAYNHGKPTGQAISQATAKRRIEQYGYLGWYDWCVSNWGTKWPDCDTYKEWRYGGSAVLTFTTAWSPPCSGIIKISRDFPDVLFSLSYSEPGVGFEGNFVCKNGHVLVDVFRDYNFSDYESEENDD